MNKDKYIAIIKLSSIALLLSICGNFGCNKEAPAKEPETMAQFEKAPIDDFSSNASKSVTGLKWTFITDQVMGGVSTGKMEFIEHDSRSCLHLKGDVSLKNRGGFIQVRRNLDPKGKPFDASAFDGIYLRVKGNIEPYAIHLRTTDTRLAWQFYQAQFRTDGTWQEFKISFKKFMPVSLKKSLDIKKLALSAPLSPGEMNQLLNDARIIAKKNGVSIYLEKAFLTTDLFPESITRGKYVLLIFKGNTKDKYFALKAEKEKMIKQGKYTEEARMAIARKMGELLSYPEKKIDELLAKQK